ncbi:MAG: M48 family metalloprotease [Planctomycetota bacterium]
MSTNFSNHAKTAALMAMLMALFGLAGHFVTGGNPMGIAGFLVFGGLMNVVAWFFSDTIAIKSMRGQLVDPTDTRLIAGGSLSQRDLHEMTVEMAEGAGLPMPKLYICPQQAPNAFATGRSPKKSAVAVTAGLCAYMNRDEVRGVIAHELAHIKNRDTLISMIAATIAGTLAFLAQWGMFLGVGRDSRGANPLVMFAVLILAAVGAALIQMAISRSREFAADREGAVIAGDPRGLMSALGKLDQLSRKIPLQQPNPAQNNLFIVEPLAGGKTLVNMFATHPPVEKRVAALQQLL